LVGRQYRFGPKDPPAVADPAPDRLALALCSADLKKHRAGINVTFDTTRDRDLAFAELLRLRETAQQS
jgi:hypothetical protein